MAFLQPNMDVNNVQSLDNLPNDNTGLTPAQLKLVFDQFGIDMKAFIIAHIAELESVLGAGNIGNVTIAGITGNKLQTTLEALKAYMDSGFITVVDGYTKTQVDAMLAGIIVGQLSPNSVINSMLGTDIKVGSLALMNTTDKTSVVNGINEHLADNTKHLSVMTTEGDTIYRGASAPARLAKGTAFQVYRMNAGATAPEWATLVVSQVTNGTFSDTTTVITAGSTYTKTIPLGFSAKRGRWKAFVSAGAPGKFVNVSFDIVQNNSICESCNATSTIYNYSGGSRNGNNNISTGIFSTVSAQIELQDAYISGTNLILIFNNIDVSSRTLNVVSSLWEVEG